MPVLKWSALASSAFEGQALANYIAVLPLGATEQHGPHLPVGTDSFIANGMIDAVMARLPGASNVVVLPALEISNSVEHTNAPGTLSIGRELTLQVVLETARGIARAGLRKMVIINAHGGNVGVMVDASHAIRAELGMLCIATNWMRLGLPDGVIAPDAKALDIHGGKLETALMLALEPSSVDMHQAQEFASLQGQLADRFDVLRAYGPTGFGWMGNDLNPAGVVGDASGAEADEGRAIVDHQARQMVKLLDEVARFTPAWFG
jgi:creatinine amidohydrolase